jgi:hypothetical protein
MHDPHPERMRPKKEFYGTTQTNYCQTPIFEELPLLVVEDE